MTDRITDYGHPRWLENLVHRCRIDFTNIDGLPVIEEGAIHKIRPLNRHELKQIPTFPSLPDYGEMTEEEKKEQWRKYAYMDWIATDWIAPRDLRSEKLNHFIARNTCELLREKDD